MKVKHHQKKRTNKFFSPDKITTEIHQALRRDFQDAQHVYCIEDYPAIAFNSQVTNFLKKYRCEDQDVEQLEYEALCLFEETNAHIGRVNDELRLLFAGHPTRIHDCKTPEDEIHLRAQALFRSVLGPFCSREWYQRCKTSSGTSLGVSYSDTSPEAKFTFPMTVTRRAEAILLECFLDDHRLSRAVLNWNSLYPTGSITQVVDASRATTVEKDSRRRRFIAIEPTGNMFLQQGLMVMLYERLAKVGLDVEVLPETHKRLARESSLSKLNATIDWSSASDCVSIELLRWLLPADWFDAVWSVRSEYIQHSGVTVPLNMISTMGNATTFPLETLVFWAYGVASYVTLKTKSRSLFPEWKDLKKCSVFGDDCVVPTSIAEPYMELLTKVGFIVNKEKSFYGTGWFRESCGGDYLAGYDVRPYHCKAPPRQAASGLEPYLYTILNSLHTKYISYFGELSYVYDKHLYRTVFDLFRRHNKLVKLVPEYFPDDAGFKASNDILRFLACYDNLSLDVIQAKSNGVYCFLYCRFVYWQEKQWYEELRYALELRKLSLRDKEDFALSLFPSGSREIPHNRPVRKRGGYVVAKALSSCWELPIPEQFSALLKRRIGG